MLTKCDWLTYLLSLFICLFRKLGQLGAPGWLSWLGSAFDSGHDTTVLGSSPVSGSLLGGVSASPSPCSCARALSPPPSNKEIKK